jgi:hypothetical protein
MIMMSANTNDNCKYMFMLQQAARWHAILDSTVGGLIMHTILGIEDDL